MDEKDDIQKLLDDYRRQKETRDSDPQDFGLEPPERSIDFAKELTEKEKKLRAHNKKKKESRQKRSYALSKIKRVVFSKGMLAAIILIAVAVGAVFGVKAYHKSSETAYLKPYQQAYPDVAFPEGILEEYCDLYGKDQSIKGYIKIEDINLNAPVYEDRSPLLLPCKEGSSRSNFVLELDSRELEKHYADAEKYNASTGFITYSDLFENYSFKVMGAFYLNKNPEDDNDYIFPVRTPEEMTQSSASTFATNLQTRSLYKVSDSLSRKDKLLIIICPTDYRKDFEFVLFCKLTNSTQKSEAADKPEEKIHFPQVIYDERNTENPYRFSKWIPELETASEETQAVTE